VSVSPQKHPATEAPAGPVPPAGGARIAENLILLTVDESLIEALSHVVPAGCLSVVADESALIQHLLSDHAGVAFIDAGALHSRPGVAGQLTRRLHNQLPDVVLVVTGDGAAQNELAALVTDGTIYRFVHKPVSAQRLKLFVESAWRKRDGTSGASGLYPALVIPPPAPVAPMARATPWSAIAVVALVIGAAVAGWVLHNPAHTAAEPVSHASAPLAPQRVAPAVVTPAAPIVHDDGPAVAAAAAAASKAADLDRLATAAEQALLAGNLVEAARLTHEARAVDPDHVRVKFLSAQLAREEARLSARTRPAATPATQRSAVAVPAAAGASASLTASVSSSPATLGPAGSAPAADATQGRNSAAAVILQRVHSVAPEFPELARQRDITGYVDLEFTVLSDGSVANVTVVKSQPSGVFDKSAVDAVRQWRYRPLARDGVAIEEHARVRLNFAYK
jgi:TonB family protein